MCLALATGETATRVTSADAVVVGGGPAGAAAAFALAGSGRRTLLIERRTTVAFKFGEMLPPHSHPLLRRFGLDKTELVQSHARAAGTVSVWGSAEPSSHDFVFNPYGDGLRLDRPRFDTCLRNRACAAGAEVMMGTDLESIGAVDGDWQLDLHNPAGSVAVTTPMVIDCTGRRSAAARQLGQERRNLDGLFGYACLYASASAPVDDPFLRIEAMPQGWLYSLVLPSGERMVVFHTDSDLPAAKAASSPIGLDQLVQASSHIGPRIAADGYRPTGRIRTSPARSTVLSAAAGPGWFAAGDAAVSFDPLSSQGMFSAIESGFAAADAVIADDADVYNGHIEHTIATYREGHGYYYAQEQRWPDQEFWRRRHEPAVGSGTA